MSFAQDKVKEKEKKKAPQSNGPELLFFFYLTAFGVTGRMLSLSQVRSGYGSKLNRII